MKVYVSTYARNWSFDKLHKIFLKKGIRWTDAYHCGEDGGPTMDYNVIFNTISSCDAYIAFMNSDLQTSFSSDVELEHAIRENIAVIAIRTNESQTSLGSSIFGGKHFFDMYPNVVPYDIRPHDGSIKNFPEFLENHIENCKSGSEVNMPGERTPDKPYDGDDPHIFISYSHQDKNKVFDIIRELQNNGYRVWYDEGIDPASEWDENIAEHISACSYLIAFISGNYINSQNCRDEISYARDLNKERLLVYLEDTKLPPGMAMRLMRLQAIHKYKYKTSSEFYEKLFSAKGIEVASA